MVKIDLITGFLGSGKTTFIRKYAKYLIQQGYSIGILENDYGAINVDMMLLSDLMGEQCELEMISGGCDKETHRRRFRTKLIAMGMCGYDRVIVEPSGIYDVDEFFDVLRDEPLDRWYEIGNVFAIVDATLEEKLSKQSKYLLATEVADAGAVILSKTQNATQEAIRNTVNSLNEVLAQVKCQRMIDTCVFTKNWDDMTDADFQNLMHAGYVQESFVKQDEVENEIFSSLYFMNLDMTKTQLQDSVKRIFNDESCGNIFRIKGFIPDADQNQQKSDTWLELNATKKETTFKSAPNGQNVVIVIGEHLNQTAIEQYFSVK